MKVTGSTFYLSSLNRSVQIQSRKITQIVLFHTQGFNKEMEEMSRVQRSYSIPDRELRESLKRDNMEYILPKYQAFYDK